MFFEKVQELKERSDFSKRSIFNIEKEEQPRSYFKFKSL